MKIFKFFKTASLEERKHVLCNQIRHLGIKVLDTSLTYHEDVSGKATQDLSDLSQHFDYRPVFTDTYITGKSRL